MIDRAGFIRFIRSIIIRSKENEFIRLLATMELKSLLFLIRQLIALQITVNLATKIAYKFVKKNL